MNILVAGEGARAFAVAKAVGKSGGVAFLLPEIAAEGFYLTLECNPSDPLSVAEAAEREQISLAVITDEKIMRSALPDRLEGKGIRVFAPATRTAELLSDRTAVAELARAADVPTPFQKILSSEAEAAKFLESNPNREYVVKSPDKTKRVVIATTKKRALAAVGKVLATKKSVIVETRVFGHFIGASVITDGETAFIAPATLPTKDGKGGRYGAVAPNPYCNERVKTETRMRIIYPFLTAMKRAGIASRGWYNFDIMLTGYGPLFLGLDFFPPETEAETVLALMKSDFAFLAANAACGTLETCRAEFSSDYALTVAVDENSPERPRRAVQENAYDYVNLGRVRFTGAEIEPLADRIATVTVATPTFNSAYHGAMDVAELSGLDGDFSREVGMDAYAEICRKKEIEHARAVRRAEIEKNREYYTSMRFTEFDYNDPAYRERIKKELSAINRDERNK